MVSAGAVGQGSLDRRAGVQCAEHHDRADRSAGEFGCDILRDAGEPQHADIELQAGVAGRLELRAAVVAQAQGKRMRSAGSARGTP